MRHTIGYDVALRPQGHGVDSAEHWRVTRQETLLPHQHGIALILIVLAPKWSTSVDAKVAEYLCFRSGAKAEGVRTVDPLRSSQRQSVFVGLPKPMGEELKGLRKRHPLLCCLHHTSGRHSTGLSSIRSIHLMFPPLLLHFSFMFPPFLPSLNLH